MATLKGPAAYSHNPFTHLNGGPNRPMPGNVSNVPHQPALKGTNVGGNVVTRFFGFLLNRQ